MYLFFLVMTFILNGALNAIIFKRCEDENMICKAPHHGISLSVLINFIPYVNISIAAISFAATLVIVNNDSLWNDFIKKYRHLPKKVIKSFEKNEPDVNFEDILTVDGAKEIEKVVELAKIQMHKSNFISSSDSTLSFNKPRFTKLEYNKARAMIAAEQMLWEIECNVSLNYRQKEQLLKLLKKAYLNDFNNPEILESSEDFVAEYVEPEMVAIGYNNNLVEKEIELEDTLENNKLYKRILKIVN